jgi:hypothetical protein
MTWFLRFVRINGQRGFRGEAQRVAKIHDNKTVLKQLFDKIPWKLFSPLLDRCSTQERKSSANRKKINLIIPCKMLNLI